MIYQLIVPWPLEDIKEIRVLEWHRQESHPLETGQLIVELETHKAVVELRATQKAILRRILCQAGDWQGIGKPLAYLSDLPDEPLSDTPPANLRPLAVDLDIT